MTVALYIGHSRERGNPYNAQRNNGIGIIRFVVRMRLLDRGGNLCTKLPILSDQTTDYQSFPPNHLVGQCQSSDPVLYYSAQKGQVAAVFYPHHYLGF